MEIVRKHKPKLNSKKVKKRRDYKNAPPCNHLFNEINTAFIDCSKGGRTGKLTSVELKPILQLRFFSPRIFQKTHLGFNPG